MKKQLWWVLALVVCVGMGALAHRGSQGAINVKEADAPYRDGSFQAKIDVAKGRKPHFSSGRWSTDQDRASFIAGYEQTYRELSDARALKMVEPSPAELAGFRDGLTDGARHRKSAQPFQANKTDNFRKAGYADANADPEKYRQFYREAYSNGYQEGYYSAAEGTDVRTISQSSRPF
jgi:hypothetical protein